MTEKDRPLEGRAMPPKSRTLDEAARGFDALNQIVSAVNEAHTLHQGESTKRARLQAYEATEIARIRANSEVLRDYFDKVFTERRLLHRELLERLDLALESGNNEALQTVTRGIVDIARSSPLADLGDLGQIRAALADPDQVWDL